MPDELKNFFDDLSKFQLNFGNIHRTTKNLLLKKLKYLENCKV